MTTTRRVGWSVSLFAVLAVAAGCGDTGPATADVSGTVTVDGKPPPAGSSISFVPADGKAGTSGCLIENGRYSTRAAVGQARVEIRAPRAVGKPRKTEDGPGGEGQIVEESLPEKYNSNTELTFDVKPGKNEKNWDLKSN